MILDPLDPWAWRLLPLLGAMRNGAATRGRAPGRQVAAPLRGDEERDALGALPCRRWVAAPLRGDEERDALGALPCRRWVAAPLRGDEEREIAQHTGLSETSCCPS